MTEKNLQHTLAQPVTYAGIGLHSGREVAMALRPAEPDSGVVFIRTDLPGRPEIKAVIDNVHGTMKATTISDNGAEVFTIEHLMAALSLLGVDNVRIELSAPEPPVADGSAAVFGGLIEAAGLREQQAERQVYAVDRAFAFYDGDRYLAILPYAGYRISFTSINKHPLLGTQYLDLELTEAVFKREIMPARTVAFTEELEALRQMGLGLGGTLENVVVFDQDKILSRQRFDNELIRHKILDIIGDMYLLGHIRGHIIAVKTGHAFNAQLARQIQTYRTRGRNK